MEYQQAKEKFIQTWGTLGSNWGINKTMAQIHALLLISPKALSTEEVMEDLMISRGNANMNIRALIDWGIVFKAFIPGERREYFIAEKDMWELAKHIIEQRKKRELDPMMRSLGQIGKLEGGKTEEVQEFEKIMGELNVFSSKAESMLNKIMSANKNWFFNFLLKLFK
ncbi:MAG: transcriptional regulator [Flammeovirgaceae bacterium]|nr:transcriptional regulator [Flammeovirgaceae bacterium]